MRLGGIGESARTQVDNPKAAAGWVRSPRWKRSHPPIAHSAKADPPPSFLSGAGPIPRSPCQPTTHSSESPPSVSMSTTPERQRDGSVARVGSDHTLPFARSAKADPPPSFLAGAGPIPRSPGQPTTHGSESPPSVSMSAPTPTTP